MFLWLSQFICQRINQDKNLLNLAGTYHFFLLSLRIVIVSVLFVQKGLYLVFSFWNIWEHTNLLHELRQREGDPLKDARENALSSLYPRDVLLKTNVG